ncbi:hypothetical protein BDB00DRAFT_835308 [Zychaea mexicana]|uniref:uncharacterized protein n=1 Tax=Zychaea mexicana TaxID=64656 RepID=UPI0022FEDE98|nr:uncharacterized protein BDB00DRAFT_835308 [Zychaea mexicana]KAI9490960.1 hypothetical protein BDB00DRAFT_835308 [Zychaea mexicana]
MPVFDPPLIQYIRDYPSSPTSAARCYRNDLSSSTCSSARNSNNSIPPAPNNNNTNSSSATSPSNTTPTTTDYEDFEDEETEATCGECGRPLGPGWQCESCRRNCPHCNRALTTDPDDFCERCFRKCDKHNIIYSIVDPGSLPAGQEEGSKCPECRKVEQDQQH